MRDIREIHIHCTATIEGREFGVKDIDQWHRKRGWNGCGYHYVIRLNGDIEQGREEWEIPASMKGRNKSAIAIAYIGGVDEGGNPKDTRTEAQKQSMLDLLKRLKNKYPKAKIIGHNEFSKKSCPCFDVQNEYGSL